MRNLKNEFFTEKGYSVHWDIEPRHLQFSNMIYKAFTDAGYKSVSD